MSELSSLKHLFVHHVKDLYNAETNLNKASSTLVNAASDEKLKELLKKYSEMTEKHINNLESVAREMDAEPTGETCHAMLGLIKEAQQFLNEDADKDVLDAGIIADVQRIAHYFITGYGSISTWSEHLNLSETVQEKCKQGISDAEEIDNELKKLAKKRVNEEALG